MIGQQPMLGAKLLAALICEHAKRGEEHAVYTLINARDQIWADNANAALSARPASAVGQPGGELCFLCEALRKARAAQATRPASAGVGVGDDAARALLHEGLLAARPDDWRKRVAAFLAQPAAVRAEEKP